MVNGNQQSFYGAPAAAWFYQNPYNPLSPTPQSPRPIYIR